LAEDYEKNSTLQEETMTPFIFLILFALAPQEAHAKLEKNVIEPSASFSSAVPLSLLTPLGIGKDRRFTCAVAANQNFVPSNAQDNSLFYNTQVACIRWALVKHGPDSRARRFIFAETEAYLLACALIISTGENSALLETVGYGTTETTGKAATLVTSDPVTQKEKILKHKRHKKDIDEEEADEEEEETDEGAISAPREQ